ncbi:phosphotransferase family protein [Pararhodobacter marinus]|uniref:Phosphotransferase family protein n=2 Tax=Pararhodobacter marinus TaxID=2184063 RepID=A0A2U2C834_9RHOB|nr:phosphotransferase family protein [Pararhodobacter marinus]
MVMAEAELDAWMAAHVEGYRGPLTLTRLKGGQSNPTWRVEASSGRYVLRQKPLGKTLPSAHQVDREYRVMKALGATDVPVPRMLGLCEDDSVMGSMFFVMEHLEGRTLWDPRLPDMTPSERGAIFEAMNDAIAKISRVDPVAVGLGDYGRQGGYVERQIARWSKQYRASETHRIEAMDRLIEWLPENRPTAPEEVRVAHGDFRLDNLMFHPTEPRVLGVLDWELSTLGDPYADFAYNVMVWRIVPGIFRGLGGVELQGTGIPTEDQYIDMWCRKTGRKRPENFDFYVILSLFRIAAIVQGIAKRAQDGTANDPQAAEMGRVAGPLAEIAWGMVRA